MGRRRSAARGRPPGGSGGGGLFLLALLGGPVLVLATLFGGAAPPAPVRPLPTASSGVTTRPVSLLAQPVAAPAASISAVALVPAVEMLGRSGSWIHVRHSLTQREGWIQARSLRDQPPITEAEVQPEARPPKASPTLSAAAITKLLIARSIADYPGPCACPYQSARNGSSCGKRAAYVRPGGYAPLCYAKDVTPKMIEEYRAGQ